jgi:hypothetical protein
LLFFLEWVQNLGLSTAIDQSSQVIEDSHEYCNWQKYGSKLAVLEMEEG